MARRTTYHYNLGGKNNIAPQAPAPDPQADERNRAEAFREMHENFRDSLAAQAERTRAALEHDNYVRQMQVLQDQERIGNDTANFRSVYGLLNEQSPNRKAQIADLFSRFPGAAKNPEIQKQLSEDNARLGKENSTTLSKEEADFLKNHGPGTSKYDTTREAVKNANDPNHINAVLDFKRAWDLKRRTAGLPSDTAGMSIDQMDQYLTAKQQPQTAAPQPTTGAQPPPPSTPGPEAVAGWSNADLTGKVAPIGGVTPAAPVAAPTNQDARKFLQQMFQKNSQAGAAAPLVADNDRTTLNDMLNQSPETQFAAPKPPPPSPTPKPTPAAAAPEQYYTA